MSWGGCHGGSPSCPRVQHVYLPTASLGVGHDMGECSVLTVPGPLILRLGEGSLQCPCGGQPSFLFISPGPIRHHFTHFWHHRVCANVTVCRGRSSDAPCAQPVGPLLCHATSITWLCPAPWVYQTSCMPHHNWPFPPFPALA